MRNKIIELLVNNNESLSEKIILNYIKQKKIIFIKKENFYYKNHSKIINFYGPAIILNSSGSKNSPKTCLHPLKNLNNSAYSSGEWLEEQGFELDKCVIFNTLPLNHISGFMPLWRSKIWNCEYIRISPELLKETKKLLQKTFELKIKKNKTLITSLVPTQLFRLLSNNYGIEWLKSFNLIWVGGAKIPKSILQKCIKEEINLSPCYGSTETAAMISALKPEEFLKGNDTTGEILSDINLRINNQNLIEIKTNRIGIEIKDSGKLKDFNRNDGWWESGDLGEIIFAKNKQYLKIHGRIDNTLNSGGETIFLDLIEKKLDDFIVKEKLPIMDLKFEKIKDELWGNRFQIIVKIKNFHTDEVILNILGKLKKFSETFPKHEQPTKWILKNDDQYDKENWKSIG